MAVTLQHARGTGERGNASVIAMLKPILSVSCVMNRECWLRWKRYITRYLYQKVVHMTEQTLLVSASPVTQGFMQREVTDGTEERVTRMSKDETYRYFTENPFLLCV